MAAAKVVRPLKFMRDTMMNLVSGMGTAKDKAIYGQYMFSPLTREQLDAAYRSDWVARKAINIPAYDSTRAWRQWQTDGKKIELIENEEKRLGLQRKTMRTLIKSRLYGGGVLVMGVGDGDPQEPLDPATVKQGDLRYVHSLSRHEIRSGDINRDATTETFLQPLWYEVQTVGAAPVRVDASRVVRFVGCEIPDQSVAAVDGSWGDSVLQAVDDAIKNVGQTSGGIATMVSEAKVDVIRVPGLMQEINSQAYRDLLVERFSLANQLKSIQNMLLLDKEEEWQRITQNFTTLPDILTLYLLITCGALDIPATRFLGQSAKGMNATGEGDQRNYYDAISSDQELELRPRLSTLDEVMVRSATGDYDPSIHYEWSALWQMDEVTKSTVALNKAQVFKIDCDSAVMEPMVMRRARENQLVEDGTYPGLEDVMEEYDTDEVEEQNPQVQAQFAAGKGAAQPGAKLQVIQGGAAQPAKVSGVKDSMLYDRRVVQRLVDAVAPGSSVNLGSGWYHGRAVRELIARVAPTAVVDAEPRSLYVRRDVVNQSDIAKWARAQGFTSVVDDMHVTLAYSRAAVDWMKAGEDSGGPADKNTPPGGMLVGPGGPRVVEALGTEGAVVLMISSSSLCWRHEDIKRRTGAEWSYDEYQPHVTITYDGAPPNLGVVEPYRGPIVLGPEIFEEVKTGRPQIEESEI